MRELKVKVESLREQIASVDKRLSEQIASVDKRLSEQISALERHISDKFEASHARTDAQFHALLAAINQSKAENELVVYKQVSALAERVSVIEAKLQQQTEARAA
ncbi:hypothetical protein [Terriglobus aquaticus]|uniref:Uncharacterized protein n=1 Tax=Terriglobus aquaticus TaxID=940139 RepID=A0ABW9KRZ5_9BACT|nr:hypothetical protein [Terriglobus aquaticus]